MDDRTLEQFEKDVITRLMETYFSKKSEREIIEIASDPQWDLFIRDGYEQYEMWEQKNPGAVQNWSASVNAAGYNIYMWF